MAEEHDEKDTWKVIIKVREAVKDLSDLKGDELNVNAYGFEADDDILEKEVHVVNTQEMDNTERNAFKAMTTMRCC